MGPDQESGVEKKMGLQERGGVSYATSLHQAVKENDIPMMRSLMEEDNGRVQAPDLMGRTPLHWALVFGHEEAAMVLIVNTPKRALDARDGFGCTALHYAAAAAATTGYAAKVARILIDRGAATNALDSKNRTPLHFAAQHVNPAMVELLISRGADKSLMDATGALPFDIATNWNSFSSIPCLRIDTTTTKILSSDKVDITVDMLEKKEPPPHMEIPSNKRSWVAEKPPRKGPSLEKLIGMWKAAETAARQKKDAEVEAAQKATATLNMALEEWRTAESEVRNLKAQISNISDLVAARETALVEGRMCGQQSCSNKPEGASTLSVCLDHKSPSINIESSVTPCKQQEQYPIDSKKSKKNDLSWCTEWEVQGMEPTTDFEFTPQDRKSPNLLHNEEEEQVDKEQVWVQVPTTIFRQNFDIGSNIGLKTSSSFDSAHFLVMVGGLSTRLPFMSSLEVY
ncbi:unnamed protein product [Sphagnum balticum]